MKTDDLKILFKSSKFSPSNIRSYILNLIQKFEVALTWDNRTLLIPSLLPDEYQLRAGYPDCEVKVGHPQKFACFRATSDFADPGAVQRLDRTQHAVVCHQEHFSTNSPHQRDGFRRQQQQPNGRRCSTVCAPVHTEPPTQIIDRPEL